MLKLTAAIEASGKDEFAQYIDRFTDMYVSAHVQLKQKELGLGGVPNETDAALFSVESFDPLPETTPVGVHVGRVGRSPQEEQMLVLRCPPIASVFYRMSEGQGKIPTRHGRRRV